tara:strand:+ start:14810 stop:15661 length:852 start_codon:yes stop_codon:yes gene_type:complete
MTVCILGSINLDHFVRVKNIPRPGETVAALTSFDAPGGKGANQAVGAARAHAAVTFFGSVGDDVAGAMLTEHLSSHGVNISNVRCLPDTQTGMAFITVAEDGENHIVAAANANSNIELPSVDLLAGCKVALAQLETPVDAVASFLKAAEKQGAIRVLNTAPALPEARTLFDLVDVLVLNEIEISTYLGRPITHDSLADSRKLLTRPEQCVVVTLGQRGAAMINLQSVIHIPAAPVATVVDTTGAGDAFCGTLAAQLCHERDWKKILATANQAAGRCVERQGAI